MRPLELSLNRRTQAPPVAPASVVSCPSLGVPYFKGRINCPVQYMLPSLPGHVRVVFCVLPLCALDLTSSGRHVGSRSRSSCCPRGASLLHAGWLLWCRSRSTLRPWCACRHLIWTCSTGSRILSRPRCCCHRHSMTWRSCCPWCSGHRHSSNRLCCRHTSRPRHRRTSSISGDRYSRSMRLICQMNRSGHILRLRISVPAKE